MRTLKDAAAFYQALHRHSVAFLMGSGFMAIMGGLEHWVGASVSWRAYLTILGLTLLRACFLAWRGEYRARVSLQGDRSILRTKLKQVLEDGQALSKPSVAAYSAGHDATAWAGKVEALLLSEPALYQRFVAAKGPILTLTQSHIKVSNQVEALKRIIDDLKENVHQQPAI